MSKHERGAKISNQFLSTEEMLIEAHKTGSKPLWANSIADLYNIREDVPLSKLTTGDANEAAPLTEDDWQCLEKLARITLSQSEDGSLPPGADRIAAAGFGKVNRKGVFEITAKGHRALRDRAGSA